MDTRGAQPIGGAFVEIEPKIDQAAFDAAINKIADAIGNKLDGALSKVNAQTTKTSAKIKTMGEDGKVAGTKTKDGAEAAATGLKKIENQTAKNISAIKKFESGSKGMESTFKRVGTRIAEAFSIYAVAEFVKKSVEVAEAYERTSRVVEQAIKTTGGAAGVSIQRFNALSANMALTTGIAETQIRAANQQLFAFTQIRDVVGKGNDIFTRAGKAVQDISVRTGLGSVQIARSLGKALEDPAKASMVLRRASVILTDQQKKQIDTFIKSGNVLKAQRVVLDAVGEKFGGAAKAAADPLKQLSVASDQIKRSLGSALIPTIDEFATAIVRHLPQIKTFVTTVGDRLHQALTAVTPAIKAAAHVVEELFGAFEKHKGLQEFLKYALLAAVAFKVLKEVTKAFLEVEKLVEAVTLVLEGEFAAAFAVIASPIAIALAAVAALAAGFYYLYNHSKPFHDEVNSLASTIKEKVLTAFHEMWAFFQTSILPTLKQIGDILEKVVIAAFHILVAYVRDILIPIFRTMWSLFKLLVLPILKQIGTVALQVFQAIPNILKTYVIPAIKFLADTFLGLMSSILNGAAKAFGWVPKIGPQLKGAASDFDAFRASVNSSLDGIVANKTITINVVRRVGTIMGVDVTSPAGKNLVGPPLPPGVQDKINKAAKAKADAAAAAALAPTGVAPSPISDGGTTKTPKAKKVIGPANLPELVRQIANALNDGLKKGSEAASKTVSSLEAKIKSSLSGTLQASLTSKTVAFIEKQRAGLVGLAGQYFKTSQATDALKKKVDTLTKAADDFKKSVMDALQQTSNLDAFLGQSSSGAGGNVDKSALANPSFTGIAVGAGSGGGQAQGLSNFLLDQSKKLTDFNGDLNKLISRIGDTSFVQELASKGLASADLVKSLASAPTSALNQINRLQSQILNLQHNIANAAGKKLQDAADRSNALLKQSVSTQDKMLVEIKALSHSIVNGLAHLLGTKVPKFAEGGIHSSPTLGWLGEAGREVTIPLTRPGRARSLMDQTGLTAMVQSRVQAPAGNTYHAEFNLVPQGDPAIHAAQVAARLGAMVTR